ncbi:MAG: hypothetical protein IT235_05485 [Bacteroidia bacterium]|nr:hypothetical protein [Bacteroidia bacterium]
MRKIFLIAFLLSVVAVDAQVGKMFPELKGITLNDKEYTIPTDCKTQQTIICLAFSKKAEDALHGWLNPMYNQFLAKTGMMDDAYDVTLFFIPMFTGAYQPTVNMAKKQLMDGTGKEYFDNVICYHGSIKKYKEELNLDEKEFPYIFILDKSGKIIYATKGLYSEKKMEEIADKLE